MRLAALVLAAGLALSACAPASFTRDVALARTEQVPESEQEDGLTLTRFAGPGLVCGLGFAIALLPEERLARFDPMMDFVTYRLEAPGRAAIIYEGNAPQEADVVIRTGRDFPSVFALHLEDGGYDKSLSGRFLTKGAIPAVCSVKASK